MFSPIFRTRFTGSERNRTVILTLSISTLLWLIWPLIVGADPITEKLSKVLCSIISGNHFGVKRRWHHYENTFPGFTAKLTPGGRRARWLDGGAGEGFAATDVLNPQGYFHYTTS